MSLKSKLKNGAVVECRNGERFIKKDNTFFNKFLEATMDGYNEDLTAKSNLRKWDIVKINNNVCNNDYSCCDRALQEVKYENKWTWERPKEILDKAEKEYLSAVIKPFRNSVTHIEKSEDSYGDFIVIYIENDSSIAFPYFKTNTMYKNMELSKKYTLANLGL